MDGSKTRWSVADSPAGSHPCLPRGSHQESTRLPAPGETESVRETTAEASIRGEWLRVPALNINGTIITATGKWLKTAHVHDEAWLKGELRDPEGCIQKLKERRANKLRADIFTFSQRLPTTVPQYSYPLEWDSIAAIRITSFKDWWEGLPQEGRKNVRRSQKRGVTVEVRNLDDTLIRDIVELLRDSPVRQGKRFAHYGRTFEQIKKDQSTHLDHSDFICAYAGNELIGLLKVVYSGKLASILQFLPKASEQDKRPANALIAKAVEVCEAKGFSYLVYGKFIYGKKRKSSLLEFKVRNGFEEILVPRFYVPLTKWGAFCVKLNLHRGTIGLLPESVIRAAVDIRARWYSVTGFLGRCSSIAEQPNRIRQTERSNPPAGSSHNLER